MTNTLEPRVPRAALRGGGTGPISADEIAVRCWLGRQVRARRRCTAEGCGEPVVAGHQVDDERADVPIGARGGVGPLVGGDRGDRKRLDVLWPRSPGTTAGEQRGLAAGTGQAGRLPGKIAPRRCGAARRTSS